MPPRDLLVAWVARFDHAGVMWHGMVNIAPNNLEHIPSEAI